MLRTSHRCVIAFLLSAALAPLAHAKRIIYVADNKEASWGEGHYRQNPQAGDVFVREADGMTLSDICDHLEDGDEVIIIAHGGKGTIEIDGMSKSGVKKDGATGGGTGQRCDVYTLAEKTNDNVTVTLKVCNSDSDPDGTGPKTTVVESFEDIFTGTGSTVTGKDGTVQVNYNPFWKNGDPTQRANALQCLADAAMDAGFNGPSRVNDWLKSLTYEEHQGVQAIIDACELDTGPVQICFTYGQPTRILGLPAVVGGIDDLQPFGTEACNSFCPLGVPGVGHWGLIVFACGAMAAGAALLGRKTLAHANA